MLEIDNNSNYFTDEKNKYGQVFTPKTILNDHVERVKINFKKFLKNYK